MAQANPATNLVEILSPILSTVFISGINIIISGHILGYVFDFSQSGKNHFTLRVPLILRLGIRGNRAFAGFAAFTISMLIVGIFLPKQANQIFIQNMGATNSQWTAIQSLAASISVVSCLILCALRSISVNIRSWFNKMKKASIEPTAEERVRKLTEK